MRELDRATLCDWLVGVTYKPGWSVKFAGPLNDDRLWINVFATEPDVCNPGQTFSTAPLFCVPDDISTRAELYNWILDVCIPGVETHERYEWFRIDGQHWRDPHAPGMPAFAVDFTG
jgi:hypothetical protein